ncbi:MAG: trypsin-like peptidase domain-containing protein [Bacteroidia bacterium]
MLKRLTFALMVLCCTRVVSQNAFSIIKTLPTGADVLDDEKNKLGETPFDLGKLKKGIHKIQISKEGYEKVAITFPEKEKNGYSFPSSVETCSSCVMDFETTDVKNQYNGTLRLRKKFKEYDKIIMVAIDTPKIDIDDKMELGRVNGSKKELKDKDIHMLLGYPENMELQLINSFKDSYLDASFLSSKGKDKATLYKPKIILTPVVKKINFTLKGKLLRDYTGPCTMECTWKISDLSDTKKVWAQLPVKTSIYRSGDNYELVLHQLLAESERDLLENDTLFDFLSGIEKKYLAKSKGDVFKLKLPKHVSYSGTREMLKDITSSVVTVQTDDGFGSGVIITSDGYIITNYHVIEGEKSVLVKLGKEQKIKAEIIKVNKDYDLAMIKINQAGLKALSIANSDSTGTGDEIFAAGTPLDKSLGQTVTRGIISGYREWNGVNFIQTDVSINAGNSGGPLLNQKGEIIGITTMKAFGRGIEGIGFGIPSNVVLEMMNIKFD